MTAEIAVINAGAVALAADSAVTIGKGKIYNSALKLFSLSKTEPVGIMIYGNAGLIGVPWETMIKVFRKDLGSIKYETLEEYSDYFFTHLESRSDFFPSDVQNIHITGAISGYYSYILELLLEKISKKIKDEGGITEAETDNLFVEVVESEYSKLESLPRLPDMDENFEKSVLKKYQKEVKAERDKTFKNIGVSRAVVTKLNKIAAMILTRDRFSESRSGVVIAGFGDKEIYPSVITHEIDGVVLNRLKRKRLDSKCSAGNGKPDCSVIPFAQDDMVYTFMRGINPTVHTVINEYLLQLFKRLPDLFEKDKLAGSNSEKNKFLKQFEKDTLSLLSDFLENMSEHLNDDHVQPVMAMVMALPKDELAAMAEALVNLTAFKRRLTGVLETVGGPIDVAVISKGDGLVWIKRKHYFPEELNRQFSQNYMRGIS